jgi:hypothetical protein
MNFMKRSVLVRFLALFYAVLLAGLALYDERLDPDVAKFLDVPAVTIPDTENAYFAMLGFEAPPGADIMAAGQQKYRTMIEDAARKQKSQNKNAQTPGKPDENKLAFKGKELPKEKLFSFAVSPGKLDQLVSDNTELLERYRSLKQYTGLAEPSGDGYAFEMPFPMLSAVRNCQTLFIMQQLGKTAEGEIAAPLEAIIEDIAYWRGVQRQSRLLITRMVAIAMQKTGYTALSEIVGNVRISDADSERIRKCLTPQSQAEQDLTPVFRQEAISMRDMYRTLYGSYDSLAKRTAVRLFIKENATLNKGVREYMKTSRISLLPPEEFYRSYFTDDALKKNAQQSTIGLKVVYNFGGELLSTIAVPSFNSSFGRVHELEALRRMVLLRMLIRERKIDEAGMPEFLKGIGREYANPFTGEPMQWDIKSKSIFVSGVQNDGTKGKKRVELGL